jgi:hypothetical protein
MPQKRKSQRQNTPKFKAGDVVKILRKAENFEDGWENDWVDGMNASVGHLGVVVEVSTDYLHNVVVYTGEKPNYGYPDFVLQHVDLKRRK